MSREAEFQSQPSPAVDIEESRFKTEDGILIYVRKWLIPQTIPLRAKILFNHGFAEHMGVYNHFFPDLAVRGYEIIGYDQRGCGKTSPLKKDFGLTNEYYVFNDLEELISKESEGYNGKIFLWGHSMGGGIVLNYGIKGKQREKINGYIASAPLVEIHPKVRVNAILMAIGPFIARVYPTYQTKVPVHYEYYTDEEEKIEKYRKDPLRCRYLTAAQGNDFLNRGKRLLSTEYVDQFIDKPVFIAQSTTDFVNEYKSSMKFFQLLKVTDKEFKSYEGWHHNLTDLVKEKTEIFKRDLLNWLDNHTDSYK